MAGCNPSGYFNRSRGQGHDLYFLRGFSYPYLLRNVQAGIRIMTREIFISKSTRIGMPLVILIGIIGCSWWVRGEIDTYKAEQAQNFNNLSRHIDQRYWQNHDELVNFAYALDQDNRPVSRGDGKTGLIVPSIPFNASSSQQLP
jgi:hypothetical protein